MAGKRLPRRGAAMAVHLVLGAAALALLALAWRMDAGWAEEHFLPSWAYPWETQLRILLGLRIAVALAGVLVLLVLRPGAARAVSAGRGRQALGTAVTVTLALAAAFAAVELILHTRTWRSTQERWDSQEPLRAPDAEYGWTSVPNHAGTVALHGRTIHYATGPHGYRIPAPAAAPELAQPTIVFAGESILLGYGLEWPETIPAQLQAIMGVQVANMAVNAHATDQTYLRLRRELPRFRQPVAVIVPFVPALFDRNLDRDRPHLDAALRWHPAERPSFRLVELARRVLRYRSRAAIEEGVATTRAALRQAAALAGARGAQAIVLVPQFLPESPREAAVRRMVLDDGHIPYLLAPVRAEWRYPVDRHPTPEGAHAIAEALAKALARPRQGA